MKKNIFERLIWLVGSLLLIYHLQDVVRYDLRWNLWINPLYAVEESLLLYAKFTYYYFVAVLITVMVHAVVKGSIRNTKKIAKNGLQGVFFIGLLFLAFLCLPLVFAISGIGSFLGEETFKEVLSGVVGTTPILAGMVYLMSLIYGLSNEKR